MNSLMGNVNLSFCIPTYNRAESVHKLVTTILSCPDTDIEVVVLDNGSTDGTLASLGTIQDKRLAVYTNGENKGGLYNVVNVIDKARGKYVLFMTDKDHIDDQKIPGFKSFLLRHSDLASGFCLFDSQPGIESEIFQPGYEAISKVAYKGRHPTGYFFNNALLKSIKHLERFSDYKFVDMFPFEFIHAELCSMGKGAIYHVPMFTLETGEMAARHKSYNASGKSKEAFFSPEARLKMAINYTKHITSLQLAPPEKKLLIIDVFIQQLVAATVGYRAVLRNKDICAHYYMECRDLKLKELFVIGCDLYRYYRNNTKTLWGSNPITQMIFDLKVFQRLCARTIQRILKLG